MKKAFSTLRKKRVHTSLIRLVRGARSFCALSPATVGGGANAKREPRGRLGGVNTAEVWRVVHTVANPGGAGDGCWPGVVQRRLIRSKCVHSYMT